MSFSLIWLPEVLKQAGLKVALVDGWDKRGHREMGQVLGVLCHHTAGGRTGNMPSLDTIKNGRSDLPGPLSQLGLGRDGTYYVIAAGLCYHAGKGEWKGLTQGNTNFIGIEAENTGRSDDSWPGVQMNAYRHGVAAILAHARRSWEFCAGHKEYALPKGRKPDPTFEMMPFRADVRAIMDRTAPALAQIPAVEPAPPPGKPPRPTLRRGDCNDAVKQLQTKLKIVPADGHFGPRTEAAVRAFQRVQGMVPDGIVGPRSWKQLDQSFGP